MEQFMGTSVSGNLMEVVKGLQNPKLILLFSNVSTFANHVKELEKLYPNVPSIGCTGNSYVKTQVIENGCSVIAFTGEIKVKTNVLTDVDRIPILRMRYLEEGLMEIGANQEDTVCIDFCTGNDSCVVTTLNMSLRKRNISLVGGTGWSTEVSVNGKLYENACVYALVKNLHGKIKTYKENIYHPTSFRYLATKTDPKAHKIITLNGRPAADVYCEALKIPASKIETQTYENPFGRYIGSSIYIISIKEKQENGIVCFKQVNEMDILTILELSDIRQVVQNTMTQIQRDFHHISGILSINCLFRYNLFSEQGFFDTYLGWMGSLANHAGFIGMGEHYNAQHINQSMSCLVFE